MLTAALLSPAGMASAQGQSSSLPDAERGRDLAQRLCSTCHVVGSGPVASTLPADVPSFQAIANKPGQTVSNVTDRIIVPHAAMPSIPLTRVEIADLAAYVMSFVAR